MKSPEEELLDLVRMQTSLGPRVPGGPAHVALVREIRVRLAAADTSYVQDFAAEFDGVSAECSNLVGLVRGEGTPAAVGAVLLGTHYDTRPKADRDADPGKRSLPIPGSNDGGSGTAVLLHMLERIPHERRARDVIFAFFDAEDLGDIDGNPFSLGAEFFVDHAIPGLPPVSQAVILDMVGGEGMVLDIDAHILHHEGSRRLTQHLFGIGRAMDAAPFVREKPHKVKYIVSDQWAFLKRGIPACLLIDIDYPQWHTHGDLPEAMSGASLRIIEEVLWSFLRLGPG